MAKLLDCARLFYVFSGALGAMSLCRFFIRAVL